MRNTTLGACHGLAPPRLAAAAWRLGHRFPAGSLVAAGGWHVRDSRPNIALRGKIALRANNIHMACFPTPAEYNDILEAAQSASQVGELQAWKNLTKREYR